MKHELSYTEPMMFDNYVIKLRNHGLFVSTINDRMSLDFTDNPALALTLSEDEATDLSDLLTKHTAHYLHPEEIIE